MPAKHLTKTDFIQAARDKFGMTHGTADEVVSWMFDHIGETLKSGGQVTVQGFGAFKPVHRPGRNGRNPATGEAIYIEPKTAVSFKPGKALLAQVNGG